MVMKRYPHGASGDFFFMKRAPSPRPDWIEICSIEHSSGNVIDFPMIQDLPALLWVVNLGCIDLNQWYARCDDVDRPDYVHFDLDPVPGARPSTRSSTTALLVHESPRRPGDAELRQDDRLERDPRLRPDRPRPDAETGLDLRQEVRAGDGSSATRSSSPPSTRSPSAPRAASSWTTTRTPGAAPSPRSTPSAPSPAPRSRRPSHGRRSRRASRSKTSACDNVPARVKKLGDLWKPVLSVGKRFRLETFIEVRHQPPDRATAARQGHPGRKTLPGLSRISLRKGVFMRLPRSIGYWFFVWQWVSPGLLDRLRPGRLLGAGEAGGGRTRSPGLARTRSGGHGSERGGLRRLLPVCGRRVAEEEPGPGRLPELGRVQRAGREEPRDPAPDPGEARRRAAGGRRFRGEKARRLLRELHG